MTNSDYKDLCETIKYGHEIEFTYNNIKYVLQPEVSDGGCWLVIWDMSENGQRLCKFEIDEHKDVPNEVIEGIINEKCFDGKSFLDIADEIIVDWVY